ncbi:MAG: cell wall-binding repeat-containing protein [Coriobacteriia bacterium]|nr:cell wall-binding repeat-containing protein [Coriobacteriia bacterium]
MSRPAEGYEPLQGPIDAGVVFVKRFRRKAVVLVALTVVIALGVHASASAALIFSGSILFTAMNSSYTEPLTSGPYVSVVRQNISTGEYDVWYHNRQGGLPQQVTPADGHSQRDHDISGSRFVWRSEAEADWEVYYDDIADIAPPMRLTTNTVNDFGPEIDGNWVVWAQGDVTAWTLRWYNIERGISGTVEPNIATLRPQEWEVDRGRVVYWDDKEPNVYGLYVYDLESGGEYTVTTVPNATVNLSTPTIHGDNVAWTQWSNATPADKNVYIENIRSGASGAVTTNVHAQQFPSLFGDLLAWQDDRNGTDDILAWWEPEPGSYQTITTAPSDQLYPDVYGHSVVYQWGTGDGSDVFLSAAPLVPLRIAGSNRYETSALISEKRFAKSGTAVLATGAGFADALSASGLAGALRGPLLLTAPTDLPTPIADELDRLETTFVFVIGGTNAIGDEVTDELDDMGISWQRIEGADRYATAAAITGWLVDQMNNENRWWRRDAFFVRGDDFADALAVAPHAYALGVPILLVRTDSVPQVTADTVTNFNIDDGYIIGGTSAISAATASDIGDLLGDAAVRWAGANRYETAIVCAEKGVERGWLDYDLIGIATGTNFPDALSGGAGCGYYGSPIMLTGPTWIPEQLDSFFGTERHWPGGLEVYGGVSAVNDYVFGRLDDYLY